MLMLPAYAGQAFRPGIHHSESAAFLRTMPDKSVNCIVTSPPYFNLRDYGVDGQIGLEKTPAEFVARLVAVFREARRVLRDDGTLWVNVGDSYTGSGRGQASNSIQNRNVGSLTGIQTNLDGLPSKSLIGIPWRLAFALQDDGWLLRADIIWHKLNPMPESVTDRPTKAHEYVFLFAKSGRYWYDAKAIAKPVVSLGGGNFSKAYAGAQINHGGESKRREYETRNARSVWTIPTQPTPIAHFATMPEALAARCIKAGCPKGGVVLDPFAGSGLTDVRYRCLMR